MPVFNPPITPIVKQTEVTFGYTDSQDWIDQVSPNTNSWDCVAWSEELTLFAAGASTSAADNFMNSSDGITWNAFSVAGNPRMFSMIWVPELGLYIACGQSVGVTGRIYTSPDGTTFTQRVNIGTIFFGAAWSPQLGIGVVVGSGLITQYTTDGIIWTTGTSAAAIGWRDVVWSPALGIFCSVGPTGANRVMTSTDGIAWTLQTASDVTKAWNGIAWSPSLGLFVAVASGGIMTSPDGVNWTNQTDPGTNTWSKVTWVADLGLFVACGNTAASPGIITSPDGINWTSVTTPAHAWNGLSWSSSLGRLVVVGSNAVMTMDALIVPEAERNFIIQDPDIRVDSNPVASLAYAQPTGKDLDEIGMDALDIDAGCNIDKELTLNIKGLEGYLEGKFKINYTFQR